MDHAETNLRDPAPRTPGLARRVLDAVHAEPRIQVRSQDRRARRRHVLLERPWATRSSTPARACSAAPPGMAARRSPTRSGTQLRELDFIAPFLRGHPKSFELAARVAELTPGDLNRIFFVNSGSEAVDTAMKVALAYHQARGQGGRNMFVSRERAYHGVNFGGVSLAGMVNNRRRFGPTLARHRAHAPHAPEGERFRPRRRRAWRRAGRRSGALRQPLWSPRTSPPASSSRSPVRPACWCRPRAI